MKSFFSYNTALLALLFINIFCPFNLSAFSIIFVLSLNRNNFTASICGLLVLLFFNLHIQFQHHAIPVFVQTYPELFLRSHSTSLPLCLFIPSFLTLFRRDPSSNSISLFWTYFESIWHSYIY